HLVSDGQAHDVAPGGGALGQRQLRREVRDRPLVHRGGAAEALDLLLLEARHRLAGRTDRVHVLDQVHRVGVALGPDPEAADLGLDGHGRPAADGRLLDARRLEDEPAAAPAAAAPATAAARRAAAAAAV